MPRRFSARVPGALATTAALSHARGDPTLAYGWVVVVVVGPVAAGACLFYRDQGRYLGVRRFGIEPNPFITIDMVKAHYPLELKYGVTGHSVYETFGWVVS